MKGAGSPENHQEVHWYPLEKPYTPIHRNAKNTQYSGFVNNLIGISTQAWWNLHVNKVEELTDQLGMSYNEITGFQQPVIESKFPGLTLIPTRM